MAEHATRIRVFLEDLPLRPTIGAALIIGLLLPAALVAWYEISDRRQTLFDHLTQDHTRIVETLAIGMQTPIWDVRPDTGKPLIDVIMGDDRVTAVHVTAPVLPRFLQAMKPAAASPDTVALEHAVVRAGRQIGKVRVEMSTAPLKAEAARQGWQTFLTVFFQMVFGLLLIFPLIRFKVLSPLNDLLEQSRALASGQLDEPLSWRRRDEFGALGRSFEETRHSLQHLFRDLEQRNTELEAREDALRQQARILRVTLDNMTDGISLIDSELRLLTWNHRFIELFEFPLGLVREGVTMTDLHRFDLARGRFSPTQAKKFAERMQLGLRTGEPFTTQIETDDGKTILLRRRPLSDGGYVTTYTDISEQVNVRREADETLHLLKTVMDAVPAILHVKGRDLRYQFVNRYFLDFFGLQQQQIIGRTLAEVLPPELLTEFKDRGPEVLAGGKALPFYEMAIRRADGRRIDMLGTKVPLLDADQQVTHVVTFEIDITERKRIQQALSDSEELYRLLVNQSPYGVLLHDPKAIVFINVAGCRTLGASTPEEIVGRHYQEFVAESDRAQGEARLSRILDPGEAVAQTERRLVTLDGREIIVATSGVPFCRGEKQLALVIFVDITEMKQAEAEIARQREALHQAEKISALGSLLAGVAHELNNPLSVVVGRSIMLRDANLDPPVAASVAKISAAAERCARIVKTFLSIARQRASKRVPVHVGALIESSLDLLAYGLESTGIRIIKQLPADLPKTMADPDQLTQVFNNLIINAKQAMADYDEPRELRISGVFDQRLKHIRITVRDNGPGIPAEAKSRIFDPFFTTKPVGTGTGIGLAVCRSFVEAHGGTITMDNAKTDGASFVVTLPVASEEDMASQEPE